MRLVFSLLGVAFLLFILSLLYSSYALKVSREHARKLTELKHLKEENLRLKASIEKMLNIKAFKRWAVKHGYEPFDWEKFVLEDFIKPSKRGQSKGRRR